jgi:hypothetical protein
VHDRKTFDREKGKYLKKGRLSYKTKEGKEREKV